MRKLMQSCLLMLAFPFGTVASDLHSLVLNADFQMAREAVREAIEGAGLVVTAVMPLNQMLKRTAGSLGKGASPFAEAETIQFCSARLAWELVEEDATQLSFCPLSLSIYSQHGMPGSVMTSPCARRLRSAVTPAARKRFNPSWFSMKVMIFCWAFSPSAPGLGL